MGKNDKQAYLDAIRGRYRKATRAGKSKILDEFCAVCRYHRKYALRRLNQSAKKVLAKKPGRRSRYAGADVMGAASDLACNRPDGLQATQGSLAALVAVLRTSARPPGR